MNGLALWYRLAFAQMPRRGHVDGCYDFDGNGRPILICGWPDGHGSTLDQ